MPRGKPRVGSYPGRVIRRRRRSGQLRADGSISAAAQGCATPARTGHPRASRPRRRPRARYRDHRDRLVRGGDRDRRRRHDGDAAPERALDPGWRDFAAFVGDPRSERGRTARDGGAAVAPGAPGVVSVLRSTEHVLAYRADSDARFLAQTAARHHLALPPVQWADVRPAYVEVRPGGAHSLAEAMRRERLEWEGRHHRAEADCRARRSRRRHVGLHRSHPARAKTLHHLRVGATPRAGVRVHRS